jgi:hypothetical protein
VQEVPRHHPCCHENQHQKQGDRDGKVCGQDGGRHSAAALCQAPRGEPISRCLWCGEER